MVGALRNDWRGNSTCTTRRKRDTTWVATDPDLPTPLAFAELDPPADPSIIFYRRPTAPDQNLQIGAVDLDVVRQVPVLWI